MADAITSAKKNPGRFILRLLIVGTVAIFMGNFVSWLIKLLTAPLSVIATATTLVIISITWLVLGAIIRPGKEEWLDTLVLLIAVTSISSVMGTLGVGLFDYVMDVTLPAGIGLTLGTVFIADAIYMWIRTQLKLGN